MTSRTIWMLKRPWIAVRMVAPMAPTEAASVGEATPAKMDPRTAIISARGGRRALNTRIIRSRLEIWARISGSMGGAHSGLILAMIKM